MTVAGTGTYKIRLEAVRKFDGGLLPGFIETRAEGRPLNPNDLSDSFIGKTLLLEVCVLAMLLDRDVENLGCEIVSIYSIS